VIEGEDEQKANRMNPIKEHDNSKLYTKSRAIHEEYRKFLLIIVFFLLGEEETSLSTSLG
jgi:hypothetical protein